MGFGDTLSALPSFNQIASGLAKAVSRAGEAAPAAIAPAERPDRPAKSLADTLLDLKLPDIAVEWVTPLLKSMNLTIEAVEARGRFGSPSRYYTVIRNDIGQRILFAVDKQILDDAANHELLSAAVAALATALRNQTLIILSDTSPHVVYTTYVARTWKELYGIKARFVPARNMEDLKALPEEDQKGLLRDVFTLDELLQPISPGAAGSRPSIDNMSILEIRNIKEIIARLNDFADIRGRQQLVKGSGLDTILSGSFDYQGGAGLVAGTMVDELIQRGSLPHDYQPWPGPPGRQALGLLLCYICTQVSDVPRKDVEYLQAIISKYSLMPDGVCPKTD